MNTLFIYFDGGCQPNPGIKYGSFEIQLDYQTVLKRSRICLGEGTNNEAEFEALELALRECLQIMRDGGLDPGSYSVQIVTDSRIVLNRLTGNNRIHKKKSWASSSERMFRLANKCLDYMSNFGDFKVHWEQLENNVSRFGH